MLPREQLHVMVSDGQLSNSSSSRTNISDGEWHSVSLSKAGPLLVFDVDGLSVEELLVPADLRTHSKLYIGGIPGDVLCIVINYFTVIIQSLRTLIVCSVFHLSFDTLWDLVFSQAAPGHHFLTTSVGTAMSGVSEVIFCHIQNSLEFYLVLVDSKIYTLIYRCCPGLSV